MLAIAFLVTSFLVGLLAVQRWLPEMPPLVRLAGGFLVGMVLATWATFILAFALFPLDNGLDIAILAVLVAEVAALVRWGRLLKLSSLKLGWQEALLAGAALVFSMWLMDSRLSGDPLTVSLNTWGDFGLHIPMVRSFSRGDNFPPEYPFFAHDWMRYHFGFDFFAGMLERQGLPIALAFNIPGALGFTAMIVLVFELARLLFQKVSVGLMAVVLLVTNGSLAFLRYFEEYKNDVPEALRHLWDQSGYLAIAPYEANEDISVYWTPNVFLNQTHFIIAIAVALFVAYGLVQPLRQGQPLWTRRTLALGALMGASFWLNGPTYLAAMVFCAALFVVFGRWRESIAFLLPAGLLALPQALWLSGGLSTGGNIKFHAGYLVDPLTVDHFIKYWWLNLGFALPLMALAALWASNWERRLMLAVMAVFVYGNLIQVGRDLGGYNHKTFNLWEILMNVFAAFAFVRLWDLKLPSGGSATAKVIAAYLRSVVRALLPVLFLFLVLSGITDFMVIKNDTRYGVFSPHEDEIRWISDHTEGDAVFLTSPDNYIAPSLAGRRLFLGFVLFTGWLGYDVEPRKEMAHAIYSASSKADACGLLTQNGIDYVQIGPSEVNNQELAVNRDLFAREFALAYSATMPDGTTSIYDVRLSCPSG